MSEQLNAKRAVVFSGILLVLVAAAVFTDAAHAEPISRSCRMRWCGWVAASKPKALGMVNTPEAIPKLRLRLPPVENPTIPLVQFTRTVTEFFVTSYERTAL